MTDEVKVGSIQIEFTTDELREIACLLDEAVKTKGISYAPIALYLHNKMMNATNSKGENDD